jgi:hypothetical protein
MDREVMASAFVKYLCDEENQKKVRELMGEIMLEPSMDPLKQESGS